MKSRVFIEFLDISHTDDILYVEVLEFEDDLEDIVKSIVFSLRNTPGMTGISGHSVRAHRVAWTYLCKPVYSHLFLTEVGNAS